MSFLLFLLTAIIGYTTSYIVSLYSLAVNIQPDMLENFRPILSKRKMRLLERLAGDPRLFLQIAILYKSLVLTVIPLAAFVVVSPLSNDLGVTGWLLFPVTLVIIWLLYVVIAELFPRRSSRKAINEKMVSYLWFIGILYRLFYPIVRLYRAGLSQARNGEEVTEEEKEDIVERAIETLAEQAGINESIVESDEKEMIGQIFLLDQTVVREIMVPRMDMVTIQKGTSLAEIQKLVKEDGHSRYPVYEENIDSILGILYVKDLFSNLPGVGEEFVISNYLRQPMIVPEMKVIGELLREFRARKVHVAVVVDEFGGVSGLVTLEDILEEIVGEIQDEHDTEEPELTLLPDGSLRVDAGLLLEELQDHLGTDFDQEDYDTVGGLIYDLVGSVPDAGAVITWNNIEFEVEQVDGQRIELVRVKRG